MKYTKPLIRITLSVIILGLLGWFITNNWDDFSNLSIEQPWLLAAASVAVAISLYSAGMVNELTMEPHGIKPTRKEVYALAAANRFLNQISTNYVGASMRAVFFKKQYGISYTKFSSSFAVANILQILISLALSVSLFFVIRDSSVGIGSLVGLLSAGSLIAVALFLPIAYIQRIIRLLQNRYNSKLLTHAYNLVSEYGHVRSHPGLFPRMAAWMIALTSTAGGVIFFLYASLGAEISILEAIFIAGIANLSVIISITPAGLGIREGMIVFGSTVVGIPVVISLSVSILLRIVITITTGLISLALSKTFTRRTK